MTSGPQTGNPGDDEAVRDVPGGSPGQDEPAREQAARDLLRSVHDLEVDPPPPDR